MRQKYFANVSLLRFYLCDLIDFFQRTVVSILCSISSLDPRLKRLCKPSSFHQLVSA